ncbi:FAD-binding protein [Azospirillum sp. 412522]|nr:FAD-binding protein [Azospirillum sp. 412522]
MSTRSVPMDTVTEILPPLLVGPDDAPEWQTEAEVVVVGWGAAGACAAIEARDAGARVLVIDRFEGGGASALSGGVVYAGGGTRHQRDAGYSDTPDAMFDYLRREVDGVVGDATLRRFCDESVTNLEWLERQGVLFGSTMPSYKTSYPPDGAFLYFSGNEAVPAYRGSHGEPAPRGHRAVARGQSGEALYAALKKATLTSGAETMTQAAVRRLVCERTDDGQQGRVIGVEVARLPPDDPRSLRHAALEQQAARWRLYRPAKAEACRREAARIEREAARPVLIRATRAVVLSTGGFIFNPDLWRQHAPHTIGGLPIGGSGCDGSGLRLGLGSGAAAQALGNISCWRFITPPADWPKGIAVNGRGERFCNEQVYGATLGHAVVEEQDGKAWLIIDSALRRKAIRQCLFGGLWGFQSLPALAMMLFGATKARTPEELASRIGADPATLRDSIAAANAAAQGMTEDPVGKSADTRHALKGTLYALDISLAAPMLPMAVLTLGGLVVDEDTGQVRGQNGDGIPGLYAAGRTALGLPSSRYVSGLSLSDCVFSGRRAGRAAAVADRLPRLAPLFATTT